MTFGAAIKSGFQNLTNFNGRARRSEFWWFYLFLFLVSIPLTLLSMIPALGAFASLDWTSTAETADVTDQQLAEFVGALALSYGIAILLSLIVFFLLLAAWVRRLHDAGYSGQWMWLSLAGLGVVPLIFACFEGNRFSNQWGPDPKALEHAAWPQPASPPQYAQPASPPQYAQPASPPPYVQPSVVPPPSAPAQVPPATSSGEQADPFASPPR